MKLSTLMVSLIAALGVQTAQAGLITVIVDDFSSGAIAAGGTFAVTSGGAFASVLPAPSPLPAVFAGVNFPILTVNANGLIGGGANLTYPGITIPASAGGAVLSYDMVFSNLGNPTTTLNQVDLNGTPTSYGAFTAPPVNTAVSYVSGDSVILKFVDNGALSWDIAIDNIKITFQCNGADDQKFDSVGAFKQGSVSCVPVPGSMGLLGLGGVALALAARRRKAK
jgi:hypothetical protein